MPATLATHADAQFRNATEALRLAEKCDILTGRNNPVALDTLAAALAAAGHFADAANIANRAVTIADSSGQKELLDPLRRRVQLYRAGQPYREHPEGRR
jgi:hypothetical protein